MARMKHLAFERLEDRTLMAGNVTAVVDRGYLNITGDDLGNSIVVEATATAGVYRIYGLPAAGSPTKINNVDMSTPGTFVEVSGVKQGVNIQLKGGDDELKFGSAAETSIAFPRWLKIDAGTGNDTVELGRAGNDSTLDPVAIAVDVRTDLTIRMGDGNDQLSMANTVVRKSALICMGKGDDQLQFPTTFTPAGETEEEAFPVHVGRSLTLRLGDGNDQLNASNLRVGRDLAITGGKGDKQISLSDSKVDNKLKITTGKGIDVIALDEVMAYSLGMNTNGGADDVTIRRNRFKRLDLDLGASNDKLTTGHNEVTQFTKLDGGIGRADLFEEGGDSFRFRIRRRF